MATIEVTYDYPYPGYGDKGRLQAQWSETQKTLNGSHTIPMCFNNTVTGCKHLKIKVEINNTGSGTILGINWDFFVCTANGTWHYIETFILPENGEYILDCDIDNLDVIQVAFVPTTNPGTSRTWENWYEIQQITFTENLVINDLENGMFQYGVFVNYYGLKKQLNEVYANVDGTLIQATDILVNVGGKLIALPTVDSAYNYSNNDKPILYAYMPPTNGKYTIRTKKIAGDHELRLYDTGFNKMHDNYFYERSFELESNKFYFITVTHYPGENEASESYLQIYKEE